MKSRPITWVAAAAMLACAASAYVLRPTPMPQGDVRLEAMIPTQFGEWTLDPSVIPIAPTPDVQANLDKLYSQLVSRAYVNPRGERVMLVVAYGGDQSDSLKAHRQEVCYQAQGFTIRDVRRDALTLAQGTVPLVRVHAQNRQRSEPMSYWFTMGEHVAIGHAERLFTQIAYGLGGRLPDGLLVRVSSLTADPATAYRSQDGFIQALLAAVPEPVRVRLAGTGARTGA